MKKYLFIPFLFIAGYVHAFNSNDWNYIPASSYTEAGLPGAVFFASGTIQFIGVTISSPAPNSYLAIYRSTSASFTSDIATQTMIATDYLPINNSPQFIPMFEMQNDSYTYISKIGTAKVTYWLRCPKRGSSAGGYGVCPGLQWSGQR